MTDLSAARRFLASSFDQDHQHQSTNSEKAEKQLKMEIKEQWLKLNKLHDKLLQETCLGSVKNPECTMLQISEAKEQRLQAEVDIMKKSLPSLITPNSEVIEAVLLTSLQSSTDQLKQTLSVVKTQRRELVEETERERKLLGQHMEVKASLEQKLEAERKEPGKPASSRLKSLEEKKRRGLEEQQRLMRNLGQFVLKHYPLPGPEFSRKRKLSGKSTKGDGNDDGEDQYLPLLNILEGLMNKSTSTEEYDPYLEITSDLWPPYVEMLLRCGIAKRHPEDSNRICMTAFHI
ncbi:centromere protein K-like [Anneissia japonica]|uniref:centromere protein K-like n=1 Tax=Anneissia japonica TaxID=1529436 RepID=UPI0014257E0E|nr:centromere protein K-like [Anneissia japonica]